MHYYSGKSASDENKEKKKKKKFISTFEDRWLNDLDLNGDLIGLWARKKDDHHFM